MNVCISTIRHTRLLFDFRIEYILHLRPACFPSRPPEIQLGFLCVPFGPIFLERDLDPFLERTTGCVNLARTRLVGPLFKPVVQICLDDLSDLGRGRPERGFDGEERPTGLRIRYRAASTCCPTSDTRHP
jgi:hypothetical protein